MAAKVFASLILLRVTKAIATCASAIKGPTDSWEPANTYSAVLAGKPLVSVPLKDVGFNRTVELQHVCTATNFPSTGFSFINGTSEIIAQPSAAVSVIQFAGASCKLSGIALRKTVKAAYGAELRLQFETCTGGPAGLAMAVVMGVSSDPTGASTSELLPWLQEIMKAAAPVQVTTTEKPVQDISLTSNEKAYQVGAGKCVGTELVAIYAITVKGTCQSRCNSRNQKHAIDPTISAACTGYAYNQANASCLLYTSPVTASTGAADADWVCVNMTSEASDVGVVAETTTAGVTATVAPTVSTLDFRQVLEVSPVSALTQISPPVAEPTCFTPVWWLKLEDRTGTPSAISLKAADYEDLLKLLPDATEPAGSVSAPRTMDRVIMDSCFHNAWGGTVCHVEGQKSVANPVCTSDAMGNAMITGVATGVGTWLIVGLVFFLMSQPFRQKSREGFDQPSEQVGETDVCQAKTVLILSVIAVAAAVGTSFGAMQLVNEMLRSQLCYDLDEALVIQLAAMLSTGLAIVIILQYMRRFHPKHGHPIFTKTLASAPAPPPPAKPELVLVPDNTHQGDRFAYDPVSHKVAPSPNASFNSNLGSRR